MILFSDDGPSPFPYSTYILFCTFFVLLSIIALNVLIGLTVNDIIKYIENADIRKLAMRLKYVLQLEDTWNSTKNIVFLGNRNVKPELMKEIRKEYISNDVLATDLVSKAKIWEKVERKQEEAKRKADMEEQAATLKKFIEEKVDSLKDGIISVNAEPMEENKVKSEKDAGDSEKENENLDSKEEKFNLQKNTGEKVKRVKCKDKSVSTRQTERATIEVDTLSREEISTTRNLDMKMIENIFQEKFETQDLLIKGLTAQVQELLNIVKSKESLSQKTDQRILGASTDVKNFSTSKSDEILQSNDQVLQKQKRLVRMPAKESLEAGWIRNTLEEAKRMNDFD